MMVPSPLRIVVLGISGSTQLIYKRVGFLSMKAVKSWLLIWWNETQMKYKLFLGLVWGWNVHILFVLILIQVDTLLSLVQLLFFNPFLGGIPFLYIVSPNVFEPSTYMSLGCNLDACPIRTLREVVERWAVELLFRCIFLINAAS